MGGMAVQISIKNDEIVNSAVMEKVRADKLREVKVGHDGTWVAHPGLVAIAKEIFDTHMKGENQLSVRRDDVNVTANDLLAVPEGPITEDGLRKNINVGLLYLEAWLRGNGCVPLYNLMEDAATAEISRAQVWQWICHGKFTLERVRQILKEELTKIPKTPKIDEAAAIFDQIVASKTFMPFLTLAAYDHLE
jgi:malate synthase